MTWLIGRWVLIGSLAAALLAGVVLWGNVKKEEGKKEVRAEWVASNLAVSEAARQKEKALTIANQGIDRAYQVDKKRRAALDRANADRLREFQEAAARANTEQASTSSGTDAAYRAIAGECGSSLVALDRYAQQVAAQAVGLQGYISGVCLAP